MRGDGWEDYLEGRERMDLIKTAQPQWKNLNISDTERLDEFFDHTGFKMIRFLAFEQHQQSNHPNKQPGVKDVLVTH